MKDNMTRYLVQMELTQLSDNTSSRTLPSLIKRHSPNLGYIEYVIPYEQAKDVLPGNRLNMFPRNSFFMAGLPNEDGSCTMNLYMPLTGAYSFDNFKSNADFASFYTQYFPNVAAITTDLETLWERLKVSYLEEVNCYPWVQGNVCLIGDAAHTI